ncbi:uncharacterized, partial [Tachysurus ichikawai]
FLSISERVDGSGEAWSMESG